MKILIDLSKYCRKVDPHTPCLQVLDSSSFKRLQRGFAFDLLFRLYLLLFTEQCLFHYSCATSHSHCNGGKIPTCLQQRRLESLPAKACLIMFTMLYSALRQISLWLFFQLIVVILYQFSYNIFLAYALLSSGNKSIIVFFIVH